MTRVLPKECHGLPPPRFRGHLGLIVGIAALLTLVAGEPAYPQEPERDEARSRRITSELQNLAQERGVGVVAFLVQDEMTVLEAASFVGALVLDGRSPAAQAVLSFEGLEAPDVRTSMVSTSHQLVRKGVEARRAGNIEVALQYQRLALLIVGRYLEWEGLAATSGNLWVARQSAIEHGMLGEHGMFGRGDWRFPESTPTSLTDLLENTRKDAQVLLPLVQGALDSGDVLPEESHLIGLTTLRRLFDLSGEGGASHRTWQVLSDTAGSSQRINLAMMATLEVLSGITTPDVLGVELLEEEGHLDFGAVWSWYLAHRDRLTQTTDTRLQSRVVHAYLNLDALRASAVLLGGSAGLGLSYLMSQLLQPIGRDFVSLLVRQGQVDEALAVAEAVRGRALGDWMARSHPTNRLRIRPGVTGSAGEVIPARLSEIESVASRRKAPLLIYLSDATGYTAWLQRTDGERVVARIEEPDSLIDAVLRGLPYRFGGEGLGRSVPIAHPSEDEAREGQLGELFLTLFPLEIRAALHDQGEQLVIIPDGMLNFVPFAALKTENDQYLVQEKNILYWPSVTAWLLTETAAEARSIYRAEMLRDTVGVLVLGDPVFSGTYQLHLDSKSIEFSLEPLPGTAEEARGIGRVVETDPLLGPEAALSALRGDGRRLFRVVHLATHGILNAENGEESFLAFSDGILTAGDLYERAGTLDAELVVMSACETGLGSYHADSPIGLSNAILVAGANTVGSTLWKIPDSVTPRLMTRFYEELVAGVDVATALRTAQLEMLADEQFQDPFFWAAFKITGRGANPFFEHFPKPEGENIP